MTGKLGIAVVLTAVLFNASATDAGRDLAANCANCHGTDGRSAGGPASLAGQSKKDLVQKMNEFKEGKRPATIMHQLAKGYNDRQIELIADYFAARKPN